MHKNAIIAIGGVGAVTATTAPSINILDYPICKILIEGQLYTLSAAGAFQSIGFAVTILTGVWMILKIKSELKAKKTNA